MYPFSWSTETNATVRVLSSGCAIRNFTCSAQFNGVSKLPPKRQNFKVDHAANQALIEESARQKREIMKRLKELEEENRKRQEQEGEEEDDMSSSDRPLKVGLLTAFAVVYMAFASGPVMAAWDAARTGEAPSQEKHKTLFQLRAFMDRNFTYSPAKIFPPPPEGGWFHQPHTLVTYMFAHGGPIHLFFCYTALGVFTPVLCRVYGARTVLGLFVGSGVLAATIHTGYEKLTNPTADMTPDKMIKDVLRAGGLTDDEYDELERGNWNLKETNISLDRINELVKAGKKVIGRSDFISYHGGCLGSSSAIIALGTICCFLAPQLRAGLLFLPVDFKLRTLLAANAAFDAWGYFVKDWGIGIGHGGHLAGNAAGLLLWFLLLRRGRLGYGHLIKR